MLRPPLLLGVVTATEVTAVVAAETALLAVVEGEVDGTRAGAKGDNCGARRAVDICVMAASCG